MKRNKICMVLLSALLLLSMLLQASGCAQKAQAADLMAGIEANIPAELPEVSRESAAKAADFAVRLFRESASEGKNTLVSPLSVLAALSMTANGARGETLAQMEQVLGMDTEALNTFFRSYLNALSEDKDAKLKLANSIWFTADPSFKVIREFLQTNADYYGADAYKAPFDDTTLSDINNWVKDRTDGMVPEILDRIPGNAVMYLVNALAFEAEWAVVYDRDHVRKGTFTKEDGTGQAADFMYSTETAYLSDGQAEGFIKYYNGKKYAFAALLPEKGLPLGEYMASLTGEALTKMLADPEDESVAAAIPRFETQYSTEMSEVLTDMGMPIAFDQANADFSGLCEVGPWENVYINRVLHRTFISVAEQGTKAGAATVVEMGKRGAPMPAKEVYLDRPFVYMLIDTETNIPFFIGAMYDLGA